MPDPAPLHPFVQAFIAKAKAAGVPALSSGSPADARALVAAGRPGLGHGPSMRARTNLAIPTRAGAIPALLLIPELSSPDQHVDGLCVFLHGGGWLLGTLEDYEPLARTLAQRSRCAVLMPDYRLAPEHPFPAGLEDCEDAIAWAWTQRAALLGHAAPMVVAGDSAGANLATVALMRLAEAVQPAGQILAYPVADADFDTPSYHQFGTGLPLLAADMAWFFNHYAPPDLWRTPSIAPLLAPDLSGNPQTAVLLAEHDVLYDEGLAYADRLDAAGRLTARREYAGMPHGFLRLHNLVDTADRAVTDMAADLTRFCRP